MNDSFSYTVENGNGLVSNVAKVDLINGNLNVQEADLSRQVKLYPNPSSGAVNIDFYNPNAQSYTLQVYTMNGMLVIADENITTTHVTIAGNTLAAGPYLYVLQGEGKSYMGKFIME
jgi:hypothetical protein